MIIKIKTCTTHLAFWISNHNHEILDSFELWICLLLKTFAVECLDVD
jgi:hypothetical protein